MLRNCSPFLAESICLQNTCSGLITWFASTLCLKSTASSDSNVSKGLRMAYKLSDKTFNYNRSFRNRQFGNPASMYPKPKAHFWWIWNLEMQPPATCKLFVTHDKNVDRLIRYHLAISTFCSFSRDFYVLLHWILAFWQEFWTNQHLFKDFKWTN